MSQSEKSSKMHTITLEEHYATPAFMEGPGQPLKAQAGTIFAREIGPDRLLDQLCDLDELRIADMDASGIDMQVLSLTAPGVEQLEANEAIALATESNDLLAEAVRRHPDRFAGFAALPTMVPEIAADELERMVNTHGFKGGVINGHNRGRYLDDPFFWPILERAEALQVPIYLHPTPPPQAVITAHYTGNYSPEVAFALATGGWGWHIETATHALRLILSGAFDRYPNLQFVIGHLGEVLPFMLPRFDSALPIQITKLERSVGDYLRENFHYTISGFNFTPAFLDLLFQVGIERIMFSADYPYRSMVEALDFLDHLPINPADKARIAHSNAERLLRLSI